MRNSGSGNKIQVGGFYGYAVFGRNGGDIKAYLIPFLDFIESLDIKGIKEGHSPVDGNGASCFILFSGIIF